MKYSLIPVTIDDARWLFYKNLANSLTPEDWLEMDRQDVIDINLNIV